MTASVFCLMPMEIPVWHSGREFWVGERRKELAKSVASRMVNDRQGTVGLLFAQRAQETEQ